MKKVIAVLCLSLLPLMASADGGAATPPAAAAPVTAPSAAADGSSGNAWRTVMTGAGIVGGVIVADLLMGGTLTASLFGWGSAATATAPAVMAPEVVGARAAGAVLGEMIAPATHARDVIARRDMFYTFVLGLGAVAGATVAYWWTGNADATAGAAPAAGK